MQSYTEYFVETLRDISSQQLSARLTSSGIQSAEIPRNQQFLIQPTILQAGVRPLKVEARGAMITYSVTIGRLVLKVVLLNIPDKAPTANRQLIQQNYGGSSSVYLGRSLIGTPFVCKRCYFNGRTQILRQREDGVNWAIRCGYYELQSVIKEYSIAKVCAALGVGIGVGYHDHKFDILCYDDCMEFFLEKCQPLAHMHLDHEQLYEIERRLQKCVCVMHSFGLVHKDIKQDNILVDHNGTILLADFGISTFVMETPGKKSLTYKEGTLLYMSPEMDSLGRSQYGLVDLYYNDMWALKYTLHILEGEIDIEPKGSLKLQLKPATQPSTLDISLSLLSEAIFDEINHQFSPNHPLNLYFKQLNPTVVDNDFNLNFLVRSFGLNRYLIGYLERVHAPTARSQLLLRRLSNDSKINNFAGIKPTGFSAEKRQHYIYCMKRLAAKREPSQQEVLAACDSALLLVDSFQSMGVCEQSEQILEVIAKYIGEEHRALYSSIKLTTLCMISGDWNRVEDMLNDLNQPTYHALKSLSWCFIREEYPKVMQLLARFFPNVQFKSGATILETVLHALNQVYLWQSNQPFSMFLPTIFDVFLDCVIRAKRYDLILQTVEPQWPCLLFRYNFAKGNAYLFVGDSTRGLIYFTEAQKIACQQNSEWSDRAFLISLHIHSLRYDLDNSYDVAPQMNKILEYLSGYDSLLEHSMVCQAHQILLRVQMQAGRMKECFEHALCVAKVLKKALMGDSFLSFIKRYLHTLQSLGPHKQYRHLLAEILSCLESYNQARAIQSAGVCYRFLWYMSLSNLFGFVEMPSKANFYELTATEILDIKTIGSEEAKVMGIILKDQGIGVGESDPKKRLKLVMLLNDLLTHYSDDFDARDMLNCCREIPTFVRFGRRDLFEKWIGLTIQRVNEWQGQDLSYLLMLAGSILSELNHYELAYKLVEREIPNNEICTYIAGVCLHNMQENESCIPLFKAFIQHSNPHNASEYLKYQIAFSWLSIAEASVAIDNTLGEEELEISFNLFAEVRPSAVWELTLRPFLLKLYTTYKQRKRALKETARLRKILNHGKHYLLSSHMSLFREKLAKAAYEFGYYKNAINDLRETLKSPDLLEEQLRGIQLCSYVFLRRLKGFYQTAQRYIQQRSESREVIQVYLRSRREAVKEYLLFGTKQEECLSLMRAINVVENGLPLDISHDLSVARRVRLLAMLKRLVAQSKYLADQKHIDSTQAKLRLSQLLKSF